MKILLIEESGFIHLIPPHPYNWLTNKQGKVVFDRLGSIRLKYIFDCPKALINDYNFFNSSGDVN